MKADFRGNWLDYKPFHSKKVCFQFSNTHLRMVTTRASMVLLPKVIPMWVFFRKISLCKTAVDATFWRQFEYPGFLFSYILFSYNIRCFPYLIRPRPYFFIFMMTSSSGNIFPVTGLLCGESTGHRLIPLSKASDTELWCFLWSAPKQTVE